MIKSFSKINFSLRIIKKLKNRMHNIQSNVFLVNQFDEIKIVKINGQHNKIIFKGPFKENIKKNDNSIHKTLKILKSKKIIKNSYKVIINKKNPVFAGLGGGTSNAAYILKHFVKKEIDNKLIDDFEKKIGSDMRLFFQDAIYQKSLKKFIKYKKKFTFNILIVFPRIKCSTKKIYEKVRSFSSPSVFNPAKLITKKKFINLMINEKNDLQPIVEKQYLLIKDLNLSIKSQIGCHFSRMTGSGSACFGVFNSKNNALKALKVIKKRFPKYWSAVTKTI